MANGETSFTAGFEVPQVSFEATSLVPAGSSELVPADEGWSPAVAQQEMGEMAQNAMPPEEVFDLGDENDSSGDEGLSLPQEAPETALQQGGSDNPPSDNNKLLTGGDNGYEGNGESKKPVPETAQSEARRTETPETTEAKEHSEDEISPLAVLMETLLSYGKEFQQASPGFRVVSGGIAPQAVVSRNRATKTADGTPKTERVFFSTANPDEKVLAQDLPVDSPWLDPESEGLRPEQDLSKGTSVVLSELAHVAPDVPSMQGLVKAYDGWVSSEEPDMGSRGELAAGAHTQVLTDTGRHLLFGAARQYDLASPDDDTTEVAAMITSIGETIRDQTSATKGNVENTLVMGIHGTDLPKGPFIAHARWKGEVSRKAMCEAAADLELNGVVTKGNLLWDTVVPSGLAFKDPEISEAFHSIMVSEKGKKLIEAIPRPLDAAEEYMTKTLEYYREDPKRYQQNVQGLLRLHPPRYSGRLSAVNVLTFDRRYTNPKAEAKDVRHRSDLALTGEAFLSVLQLTRSQDPEVRAAQYEEDRKHAEVVGSLASRVPSRQPDAELARHYFDRPDLTKEEKEEIAKQYALGLPPQRIYAAYRRKNRVAQEARGVGTTRPWGLKRPGHGRLS